MLPERRQLVGYFLSPILSTGENLPAQIATHGSEHADHIGREMK
jgi:hypothetical protein